MNQVCVRSRPLLAAQMNVALHVSEIVDLGHDAIVIHVRSHCPQVGLRIESV